MALTTDFKIALPTVGGDNNTWGGTLNTDIQAFENILKDMSGKSVTTGSANAYVYTPNYTGVTALFDGLAVRCRASFGNTGACTLTYNGLITRSIVKIIDGVATNLVDDDIAVGMWMDLIYNDTNIGSWVLMNPSTLLQTGTAAQLQFGTVTDRFPGIFQYWQAHEEVVLTDAATIAWDMATGINFAVTLLGNRTLGFPTNLTNGKTGTLRVLASAADRTLTFGSSYSGPQTSSFGIGNGNSILIYYRCISAVAAPGTVILDYTENYSTL